MNRVALLENLNFAFAKTKLADQLRGNHAADQHLCIRYKDSTIPLLPKSEISILMPFTVAVQPSLSQTWSQILKTCFHATRLKWSRNVLSLEIGAYG